MLSVSGQILTHLVFIVMMATLGDYFPPDYLLTEAYAQSGLLYKVMDSKRSFLLVRIRFVRSQT